MRGKDNVPAATVLPVFLKLFRCKDKELRSFLHGVIISDLKLMNANSKKHNVNKKLQGFIASLLQDPNEDAARRALNVMIELYKRKVWNDEKTVNTIWSGVLHENPKIVLASCKFFLALDYSHEDTDSGDSSSELEEKINVLKQHKGSKLSKQKRNSLDRAMKAQKRKNQRKAGGNIQTDFLPIDMLYDPQTCAEKLFSKLKSSNEKYEVKLFMLRLVSRLIGRHRL